MYIVEFTVPGTFLVHEDREWAWKTGNLLSSLQDHFIEANLALNLFNSAQAQAHQRFQGMRERHMEEWERKQEIRQQVEADFGGDIWNRDRWQAISDEADARFKREKWAKGHLPREFEHNLSFIYAKAFLYALDAFDKFLGVIAKDPLSPAVAVEQHTKIQESFPNLRGVRNTAQHLEDRARGLGAGSRGKPPAPMDLKPIDNGLIRAPGGALVLNSLNGSKYGSTMSDGHYGEVDVSIESLHKLKEILHAVLHSFAWQGPAMNRPSA